MKSKVPNTIDLKDNQRTYTQGCKIKELKQTTNKDTKIKEAKTKEVQ